MPVLLDRPPFVRVMNGYKMSAQRTKCGKFMAPLNVDLGDLPTSVDWRDIGYVTGIKNQVYVCLHSREI